MFVKGAGTLLAGAALMEGVQAADTSDAKTPRILPINRNWRYSARKMDGATAPDFDDSGWTKVTVPHTNIPLPWHSFSEDAYQFISQYRRHFKLPAGAKGKHVFVDFEGVMLASTVWLNGTKLGTYLGGYTPFSFDLTDHVHYDGDNVLVVEVDSRERPDIPPFGDQVDYLTFGGIYREVSLRVVPDCYIDTIFAKTKLLSGGRVGLEVDCTLARTKDAPPMQLQARLYDDKTFIASAALALPAAPAAKEPVTENLRFVPMHNITLWDLDRPKLYRLEVRLLKDGQQVDADSTRIGMREAHFTDHGFELNGKVIKLRGLDHHQMFPFVGQAMAGRAQRRDARILRKELKCNIVRTSHYPQSRHFLDACDEYGLLVLEEIPGWQHIGDAAWKDISVDNVRRMITRDRNHPAIILWGVRINESADDHDFYTRTNALAHKLDPTRATGGIRNNYKSELLEDVFTLNDFAWPMRKPNHPHYLVTEFIGHTYPVRMMDDNVLQRELAHRHARGHDTLASDHRYAGGIAWCAFDYNTHAEFGSGDRICYHGVTDIFRTLKPAANFYRSQCDPKEEIVMDLAMHWAGGDEPERLMDLMICSNCDFIRVSLKDARGWGVLTTAKPDHKTYPHLKYPPYHVPFYQLADWRWGDLKLEGFIKGKLVMTRLYSGDGVDHNFELLPDDLDLIADGADVTRVVLRVTDPYGNARPLASDPIVFALEGEADLIGDNPFSLVGGTGAVWVRAREKPGIVKLSAKHPRLGVKSVLFRLSQGHPDGA